jgi:hypothetical protein
MRSIAAVLICAFLAIGALAENESNVTIPLTDYEQLKKTTENASATVIDTMTLGGTFKDRNLTVTFAGRNVGTRTATNLITDAGDVTLSGCTGDALLTRGSKGSYQLIALAPAFTLKCDVRLSGSDRLPMKVQPSVLSIRSAVADGELVAGEEENDGARTWTLVRQVAGTNETLAATATGRYLITLLPDTTSFRYVIQVHNPNRSTSPLPLHLVSGEHLQQIDSNAPYEVKDNSYVFAMPPGDSTITLSGELQGTSFAPPVAASLQYAVIESHPLLRPTLQSSPKRVSTGETGIETQYRGALAFEIGEKERISWSVTRLEAMRAISYAVHRASHTLFVPANGPILGESEFALDNQGAPELVLPQKPEPTYVALQNEPVLMTKNKAGELTIPLSAGEQKLVVQHRQNIRSWGILAGELDVPRVPVQATNTHVEIRYPTHWLPLWQSFATQVWFWKPEPEAFFTFIIFALWVERVLLFLGVPLKRRLTIAGFLAYATGIIPTMLWIVAIGCLSITVLWLASHRARFKPKHALIGAFLGLVVLFLIVALSFIGKKEERYDTATTETAASSNLGYVGNAARKVGAAPPPPPAAPAQAAYQGLPAKFELPSGDRSSDFNEQLLAVDRPQTVQIVLLSMTIVTWAAALLTLIAAWLLWRERVTIKQVVREKLAAAATPAPAPAAPATA